MIKAKKLMIMAALIAGLCLLPAQSAPAAVLAAEAVDTVLTVPEGTEMKHGGGYAATGQLGQTGYMARLYDASNGLPTSDANCVFCASDGYIYIGGYSGIIRYDGSSFERLDASDGLTNGRTIFEDREGRLWVGTNDNGVVVMDGEKRTHYTYEDGLASSSIRCFAQGNDGTVYIGSTGGIAYVDTKGELSVLDDERVNTATIIRLFSASDGHIYGNTKDGEIFTIDGERISAFYTSEELGLEMVSTIYPDPDKSGEVYLGTESDAVYHGGFGKNGTEMKKMRIESAPAIYYITSECGRIWITSENIAGYIDETGGFHVLSNIPMDNSIDMMTSDYQGNLWFASSRQGVMKVVTSNFRDINEEAGLDSETVNTTCLYHDRLYIGTDLGLTILDDELKKVENELTEYLGDTRIRCISIDNEGQVWISTFTNNLGLVCCSSTGKITNFTVDDGMPDNRVRSVISASDGSVLAGTNGGLAVLKDGKVVRTVGASDVVANTVFLTVCEGDNGTIYAGSDGDGIYEITGDSVRRIGREEGLTSDVIMRIKKDDQSGVYWIVTSNSIQYMKDGKLINVDSFPYNNNYDVFTDDSGNLWVLSSVGLYCMNVQDVLDNKVSDFKLYTTANGLPSAPTGNSYSALDSLGNLYITGRAGVCETNIEHFFEQNEKIKTGVKSIYCNDSRILPDAEGLYTIPAVNGRIQIMPAILDYTLTDPLVHVFLEGTEDPGFTCELSRLIPLEYTGLSYGNYTLHIQILDKTSREILQDDTFPITKNPRLMELFVVRLLFMALLVLAAGFIVWGFMRSTIVRKQYDEIRKARDEAERANLAKSRFLANMSHEIRTPINTIMGMNEMILREDPTDVPKGYFMSMINYSLDIRNATESLLGLINDLLDMSKIESGKMHLVEQEYEIQDMLRSVVSMIRARSTEKQLTFDVTVDVMLPRRMYGDVGKIKQIVLNLLTNAVKYTETGGFILNVSMEERANDDCLLRFSVKDTGMGVREEDMEKLFTAYERLDEEKNSAIQGTGLGLDISSKFAELMGGKLWCESVYGEGSEFILTLTQRIVDATPLGAFIEHDEGAAKGPYVPKFIAPDADILVVDDNPMNLNVIKGLLKATKVFVTTASSGEEALDKIRLTHFDVVLLDHMMPGMDGIETVENIRKTQPELPVYALTANNTAGEEFYRSKGFNGYLSKPVESDVLESTIMKHLPESMMEKPTAADAVAELTELPEYRLWLREAEGISADDGIKVSGGIMNFLNSVELFYDTIDSNAKVISDAYESGNLRLYTIKVHALKSSARIIGATELSKLAESLEDAGNREDTAFIDDNTGRLMTDYMAFKEILKRIKEDPQEGEKEPVPEGELSDAYEALAELVPQMDYDSVEMILEQLGSYALPEADARKLSALGVMLKALDWEGMEKCLKE